MPRKIIDTGKALYSPIEIEIDGKVFTVGTVTTETLELIDIEAKKAARGDMTGIWNQLHLLAGVPKSVARKIDIRDLTDILDFTIQCLLNPEKKESKKEKK